MSPAKRFVMVYALYSGKGSSLRGDKKGRKKFKYSDAAEYLSKYPKFIDNTEFSTKLSEDLRLEINDCSCRETDIKIDGGETRPRRPEADENTMEYKKNTINTEGGDEIRKEIPTGHRKEDGTELRENVGTGHNVVGRQTEEKPTEKAHTEEITPLGQRRRERRVRGMGTKAQRDMQQQKKRKERTEISINPVKMSMDDEIKVLKSFVASHHETNVDDSRDMYLQGL